MNARILLAAAAALAAALPAFPRQETPKKDEMELKCAVTPGKGRPQLRLEGQVSTLPEGTLLNLELLRVEERSADGKLSPGGSLFHSEIVRVERKKFLYLSPAGSPPGYYRASLRLQEESQVVRPLKALKEAGILMPQQWIFDYTAWGDDLAGRLSPALREFDALVTDALALVGKFAEISGQRPLWEANAKTLDRDATKLMQEIERSEAKKLYPAACNDVTSAVNTVQGNARFITFRTDGMFDKIVDYHTGGKPVTFRNEEFSWDVMKKYLNESSEVAGREFALWAVKDTRRAGGKVSEALVKAIKDQGGHAGVSPYVNRLQQGDKLDELEKTIREKK